MLLESGSVEGVGICTLLGLPPHMIIITVFSTYLEVVFVMFF